jgi:hypothetical protein
MSKTAERTILTPNLFLTWQKIRVLRYHRTRDKKETGGTIKPPKTDWEFSQL